MSLILIVSSSGGHAEQARLLGPAFAKRGLLHIIAGGRQSKLRDCSLATLWRVPLCFAQSMKLLWQKRPELVLSTGALPGLIAIIAARCIGAQTVWIDSVANAKRLSLSGRAARYVAHQVFSQWPEVAQRERVAYAGAVI